MIYEIVIILLLVLINGIFVMSEISIVSARKLRLQQRADEGDENARAALELANSPNRFLSTTQIGITLISILAGAFGGATLANQVAVKLNGFSQIAPYSGPLSVAIVVLGIAYLTLVIGELVPKRIGLNSPERIASMMAATMNMISKIASPAIFILSASTDLILRGLKIKPSVEPPVTEEEIKILIEEGTRAGVFEETEQDIMERVFRLGDRRADTIMTPRSEIVWLDVEDTPEDIQRKIASGPYSLFPVCKRRLDNVLGIVQAKDLLSCSIKDLKVDLKSSLLPPQFIPESMRALKVLERFKQTGIHLAIVLDEYGSVRGIVTLTNILEAIVGDIPHIQELSEPQIVQREDGSWLVDGMLSVEEFKEALHIDELPGEESGIYQTMGGFMMTRLEKIPISGDHFIWDGYRFEVVDMDSHRVDKLLVMPLTEGMDEAGKDQVKADEK
ncbi:MAG: hemolysin family protein [Methanotrichaceae archaeon]